MRDQNTAHLLAEQREAEEAALVVTGRREGEHPLSFLSCGTWYFSVLGVWSETLVCGHGTNRSFLGFPAVGGHEFEADSTPAGGWPGMASHSCFQGRSWEHEGQPAAEQGWGQQGETVSRRDTAERGLPVDDPGAWSDPR